MIEKRCPACEQVHPARMTRQAPGFAEWICEGCGSVWTVKDGDSKAYYFFEPDIDRAFGHEIGRLSP